MTDRPWIVGDKPDLDLSDDFLRATDDFFAAEQEVDRVEALLREKKTRRNEARRRMHRLRPEALDNAIVGRRYGDVLTWARRERRR